MFTTDPSRRAAILRQQRPAGADDPIRLMLNERRPPLVGDVLERRGVSDTEVVDQDVGGAVRRSGGHVPTASLDALSSGEIGGDGGVPPALLSGQRCSVLSADDDPRPLARSARSAVAAPIPWAPAATNAGLPAIR